MNNYATIINDDFLMVVDTLTGKTVKIHADDESNFEYALNLIRNHEYNLVFDIVTPESEAVDVAEYFDELEYSYGTWKIDVNGKKYDVHHSLSEHLTKMHDLEMDLEPIKEFIKNLYKNPSKTSIDELFLFIEASGLPITEDGHFIAYKIVGHDYKDLYSHTFDNSIGATPEMERFEVDDVRDNLCSTGLHFCSKTYLPHYGSSNGNDRCMLVKINPADVVSIPSDYNNAKGRTCRYEVVGEIEGDWRKTLELDYTDRPVVSSDGSYYGGDDPDDEDDEYYDSDFYLSEDY